MRPRRRRERGQVLPISVILTGVLLGGAALAVDLSIATMSHRDLQNASDAAALSGARDLGASNSGQPNETDRVQGAIDALRVVYDHMRWGTSGAVWATAAVHAVTGQNCGNGAGASHCDVTTHGPGSGSGVTVTVDIPPLSAPNTAYDEQAGAPGLPWGYAEVDMSSRAAGGLGGAIGLHAGPAGSRSVAYHLPGGQPFGFALYSNTVVTTGNQDEVVNGNVYAYRDISPQSSGHADFCAGPDANGNEGSVILGAPQSGPFPSPDPAAGSPYQQNVRAIASVGSCAGAGGGAVSQTENLGSCGSLSVRRHADAVPGPETARRAWHRRRCCRPTFRDRRRAGTSSRRMARRSEAVSQFCTVTTALSPACTTSPTTPTASRRDAPTW